MTILALGSAYLSVTYLINMLKYCHSGLIVHIKAVTTLDKKIRALVMAVWGAGCRGNHLVRFVLLLKGRTANVANRAD